jgi:hypothetical protein
MAGDCKRRAGNRPWPKPLLQYRDKTHPANCKAETNASQPEKLAEGFQREHRHVFRIRCNADVLMRVRKSLVHNQKATARTKFSRQMQEIVF